MDFFLLEKKRLSFQRAKEHSLLSQKKPFFPSYTGAPQRGHTPTASCAVPLEEGKTYDAEVILDDTGGKYVNFKLEFPVKKGRRK